MGYNKYLWGQDSKQNYETFGQLKISPIDETPEQTFEVFIHYGTGHRCDIADRIPDNIVPKALYLFDISYYRIDRIYNTAGLTVNDGILVETRRIINRQIGHYGHTRYYLVRQLT